MANKEQLNKMIDNIMDGNTEQAQTNFHTFVKDKMSELLKPEVSSTDTEIDSTANEG